MIWEKEKRRHVPLQTVNSLIKLSLTPHLALEWFFLLSPLSAIAKRRTRTE